MYWLPIKRIIHNTAGCDVVKGLTVSRFVSTQPHKVSTEIKLVQFSQFEKMFIKCLFSVFLFVLLKVYWKLICQFLCCSNDEIHPNIF